MGLLDSLTGSSAGTNYETHQLGTHTLSPEETPGILIQVQPHSESNGINDMAGVLQSVHDVITGWRGKNESPHHAYELWFDGDKITFYFHAASERAADKFRRRVGNNYANSQVFPVKTKDAFPAISPDQYVCGSRVNTRKHAYYPIHHHEDQDGFERDPYGEITSEMISDSESMVVVQTVFKPAKRDWTSGESGFLGFGGSPSVEDIAESLRDGTVQGWRDPHVREASVKDKQAAKIVEQQRGGLAFHTNIRVIAASPDPKEAEARARGVSGMFVKYYNSETEQGFDDEPETSENGLRELIDDMHNREFIDREDHGMTLTVDELASAAHIPNSEIETPLIDWRHQKSGDRIPAESARDEHREQ